MKEVGSMCCGEGWSARSWGSRRLVSVDGEEGWKVLLVSRWDWEVVVAVAVFSECVALTKVKGS